MEKVHDLMMVSLARLSTERFDKRALLQLHDFFRLLGIATGGALHLYFPDPSSSAPASPVPAERLNAISFTELQVDKVHRGQVVYGTLCTEAFWMNGVFTLLEDDNGLAVRLAIYNAASSEAVIKKLYPKGARVAIKEPCFKRGSDGGLAIRVDNPANVEYFVSEEDRWMESLVHVNIKKVRKKGNRCLREHNWAAAAELYTTCIDAALRQLREKPSDNSNNINAGLLHAYSNRAETWLQLKEFKRALEDSNEALRIDPGHLKGLYRKGRALLGLRNYRAACEYLEKADRASLMHWEIQEALSKAKTLYTQSQCWMGDEYQYQAYAPGQLVEGA